MCLSDAHFNTVDCDYHYNQVDTALSATLIEYVRHSTSSILFFFFLRTLKALI